MQRYKVFSVFQIDSITVTDEENKVFDIVVSTDAVALFVWLDSHEIRGRFSQNGFLQVEATQKVQFWAEEPIEQDGLLKLMTVTHLKDPVYL